MKIDPPALDAPPREWRRYHALQMLEALRPPPPPPPKLTTADVVRRLEAFQRGEITLEEFQADVTSEQLDRLIAESRRQAIAHGIAAATILVFVGAVALSLAGVFG